MKKITLLCIGLLSSVGFAQVSYVHTDYAEKGESYIVSAATAPALALDYVKTGTNFSWDYSALVPLTQETLVFQNPNNAGYKNAWCFLNNYFLNCNTQFNNNFTLATKLPNGFEIPGYGLTNVIDHLKLSTTSLQDKMIGATITLDGSTLPFVASYQTADVLYQFPINYTDNYTNPFALSIDLSTLGVPVQYASAGQRTNVVEGWGFLKTPFGTFANVLKMKSTVVNTIRITNDGATTENTITTVSYKWFDKAYGIPVLQVDGPVQDSQWVPNQVTYYDIQRCLAPNATFAYLPVESDFVPANNNASVSFINTSINYDSVSWNFGDGSAASSVANPTHNYSCPGVKQVTLTITNTFCDPDQTATITIPVTIRDTQNAFTTNVTAGNTSLSADRTLAGTTYQWLDCNNGNSPIPNATAQTYTPAVNGNYAVQLTTNGCVSISACYLFSSLGTTNVDHHNGLYLYPNPTKRNLSLSNNTIEVKKVTIANSLGVIVGHSLDISSLANGIYLVTVETNAGFFVQKIIKE